MNSLDRLPQIPQDYANHIIYGGVLGMIAAAPCYLALGYTLAVSLLLGTLVTFAVTAGKKIYDYIVYHETLQMCVAKTFVTAVVPFLFYLETFIHG